MWDRYCSKNSQKVQSRREKKEEERTNKENKKRRRYAIRKRLERHEDFLLTTQKQTHTYVRHENSGCNQHHSTSVERKIIQQENAVSGRKQRTIIVWDIVGKNIKRKTKQRERQNKQIS